MVWNLGFKAELKVLRDFVRWDRGDRHWPISMRRIYPGDCKFRDGDGAPFQALNEFDILTTSDSEYFVILAIFGVEYAMNLGGPELEGFEKWLAQNGNKSPLYTGKNAEPGASADVPDGPSQS